MNDLTAAQFSEMLEEASSNGHESPPPEPTEGTTIARENRKVRNTLSQGERDDLIEVAMAIVRN